MSETTVGEYEDNDGSYSYRNKEVKPPPTRRPGAHQESYDEQQADILTLSCEKNAGNQSFPWRAIILVFCVLWIIKLLVYG